MKPDISESMREKHKQNKKLKLKPHYVASITALGTKKKKKKVSIVGLYRLSFIENHIKTIPLKYSSNLHINFQVLIICQ